uniref:Mitochondrial Rho GTPase 1 n=1 Tax=Setaria digitata TaxID=48799 RepID=A0A915Q1W6_9BILA
MTLTQQATARNDTSDKNADVRILLIGEPGVGKTSLIMSLLEDEFCAKVPPRIDNIMIPADVTPEGVVTSIHDYCASEQSEDELKTEIESANVVCLVYAVDDHLSIEKATDIWLPLIKQVKGDKSDSCPIIFVGNKSDEAGPSKHIEKLCDFDNDGLLNDAELNHFQLFVFGVPLTASAVSDVKMAVRVNTKDGVIDDAIALPGFIYLHQLFIHRGRHETTWRVLRRFGYDNELELAADYMQPSVKVPKGSSTELTQEGFQFITALFRKFDEDKDGCLSPVELQNLFSVCSPQVWSKEANSAVETNHKGWLTYNGYVAYWILTTFLNVSLTMELLAYLGFNMHHESQLDAIKVTRDRRIDITEKSTTRTVFQCHVIGPKGAGKTIFTQSFAGRNLMDVAAMGKKSISPYVLNSVKVKQNIKYLLLHEVDVLSPDEALTTYEKSADVIVLLYDITNPDSFAYCASIYLKYFYRTKVPCVIVATKSELCEVEQKYEQQPSDFCRTHSLPQPLRFRLNDIGKTDNPIFLQLAMMAVYPHLKRVYYLQDSYLLSTITVGAAIAALAGFLLYRNL